MIGALASHELKIFQSVPKEGPDVPLAVNNTDARSDLPPTEDTTDRKLVLGVCFHITAPCKEKPNLSKHRKCDMFWVSRRKL
jgi:hypothetical protein